MIKYTAFYIIVSLIFSLEKGLQEVNIFEDRVYESSDSTEAKIIYDRGIFLNDSLGEDVIYRNVCFMADHGVIPGIDTTFNSIVPIILNVETNTFE
jgi:hypothetical protein